MKRGGLLYALALVLVVNGIVLAGVAYNRSGEPDTVVQLTERELPLETHNQENSAVSLRLTLQRQHDDLSGPFPWLDRGKLEELGFDCRTPPNAPDAGARYSRALPRRTWLVLEYEGAAWQAWLLQARQRLAELARRDGKPEKESRSRDFEAKRLWQAITTGSRLFAIDAGNDPALLRKRYPDRQRCIITPALVRIQLLHTPDQEPRRPVRLTGYVQQLLGDSIQVPRELRDALASLGAPRQEHYFNGQAEKLFAPRYRVTLSYGKRYEPWVTALHRLNTAQPAAESSSTLRPATHPLR
jgi:hypothetical protein